MKIALTAVLLLSFITTTLYGQTVGGTILGRVKDQTGGILPGADVTIKNTATGLTRAVITNETGAYNAINLQPGIYEVMVEMPSFSIGLKKGIALNVGDELLVDFELRVEGSTESVEVTAQETRIDLVAAAVNRTVEGTTIREAVI
jgi:hypothetical protein